MICCFLLLVGWFLLLLGTELGTVSNLDKSSTIKLQPQALLLKLIKLINSFCCCYCFVFETVSQYVALAGLELFVGQAGLQLTRPTCLCLFNARTNGVSFYTLA